jgi:nucleotide-binding universal stress UspA family protein
MVRVLVPVAVLGGETVASGLVDLLAPADVVLLGYHEIPEQTTPEQAQLSFEEPARANLADVAEAVEAAGASVETRLAFTHDREQTIDRVAADADVDVVVFLNPAMAAEDLLVVLHGNVAAERIGRVVAALVDGRPIAVTLCEILGPDADALNLLERTRDELIDGGVPAAQIEAACIETETPVSAILDAAVGMDAVVMGDRAPTWREFIVGDVEERVADASLGPVLVVRRREPPPDGDGGDGSEQP